MNPAQEYRLGVRAAVLIFDCDDALDEAREFCPCRRRAGDCSTTMPTPKLDPEMRPNVPPRMM